ncbi:hypothetical protein ABVT39_011866 [Epinephelus coioides]
MYRTTRCGNAHCSPKEGADAGNVLPPIHMEAPAASFHLTARSFTRRVQRMQRFKESPADLDAASYRRSHQPVGVTSVATRNAASWVLWSWKHWSQGL